MIRSIAEIIDIVRRTYATATPPVQKTLVLTYRANDDKRGQIVDILV